MPAELLLLLIVAFASPSCQVLSSLRMGEALQRCPCLLRDPPTGPRAPLWEPRQASSSARYLGVRSQLSSAARSSSPSLPLPWTQESKLSAPSSLRPRSLDPSPHPHPHLRAQESRTPIPPPSGPESLVPNPCVPSAAILDDQTVCGRGERLALALAREQINGIIEVPAKARVEVDIFELQRDSQYETTDTSEQGHRGRGLRLGRLVALRVSLGPPFQLTSAPSAPSFMSVPLLPRDGAAWCGEVGRPSGLVVP